MSDYTVLLFFPKECFPSLERGLARWQNSALWRRILRGQGKCPDAAAKDPTLRLGDPGEPGSRQKRESVMQMHERMWEVQYIEKRLYRYCGSRRRNVLPMFQYCRSRRTCLRGGTGRSASNPCRTGYSGIFLKKNRN